ncbi:MAG: NUDIX domain-containing protein [Clostridia bacterium]|nr:NUDIX domain-containing protein [Clostridia bacterium]
MRASSRAVVIEDGKLLTMFRRKIKDNNVKEYYVIPGGGIDEGETSKGTVVRELQEEMNVDINILGFITQKTTDTTIEDYWHCEIVSGTPQLGGEELERMTEENYYEPRWVKIEDLENLDFTGLDVVELALNKEYK